MYTKRKGVYFIFFLFFSLYFFFFSLSSIFSDVQHLTLTSKDLIYSNKIHEYPPEREYPQKKNEFWKQAATATPNCLERRADRKRIIQRVTATFFEYTT